ncbi:GNAT family N-acetyltransferase [Paenibacillus hexagrammi]|uniref:GNAT family N-acetyltransferase n=1 Tax=Paenibacillus hexagrammi TaxID=2908839 RepID=A0ABY3SLB5_9BACL|nr:GNAT family N-acetyltransferase [Paenibacillus sp. YPD9-1]UJF33910.1 GNAT family N-acetyltransferase [Paenibacillus sp. YPD9-1]
MSEIQPLQQVDKKAIMSLYRAVTKDLRKQGNRQWDWFYPNGIVIGSDLKNHTLYGMKVGSQVTAAVALDANQSPQYAPLPWSNTPGKPACVHRLAVHPDHQGKGLGKRLLAFAEELAMQQGYSSIRLDVYTGNPGALAMYVRAGYRQVGEVRFPFRETPYMCMEKILYN